MNLGIIIGRFQTSHLHEGHVKLIEHVASQHHQIMILLGCTSALGSKRNPLDYPTREKMLKEKFPDILVAPIMDNASDLIWSSNVDTIARIACPVGKIVLYGGRDSFIPHYMGGFTTVDVEVGQSLSGTDVRRTASNKILVSSDFRAGVIYNATNQYDRVFPTVDIAGIRDRKVLLGRKSNEDSWRFPGGFVDQDDISLEYAALREFKEETSLRADTIKYLGSFRVNDWRYRHKDDGVILTIFFMAKASNGIEKASDDLEEVAWWDIDSDVQINKGHLQLLQCLKESIK